MNSKVLSAGRPSKKKSDDKLLQSLMDDQETKRVSFVIPAENHRKLKMYAAQEGKTVTEILNAYIEKVIQEV